MGEELLRRAQRLLAVYGLPKEKRALFEAAERRRCAGESEFDSEAFIYWCNNYGWVRAEKSPVPDLKNAPFVLWPRQEEAVRFFLGRLQVGGDALVPKSREVGITWLVLHLFLWLWIFHHASLKLGSRKEDLVDTMGDLDTLFERLRYILKRQPAWVRPSYEAKHLLLQDLRNREASIVGEATNPDFGRGGRRRVIAVDEFGAIEPRIADATIRSTDSAGPTWFVYNPAGEAHPSYKLFTEMSPDAILTLDWRADPYRPPNFPELKIRPNGKLSRDDFDREYGCSHKAISEGLIYEWSVGCEYDDDADDAASMRWREIRGEAYNAWPQIGGWDFGSGKSLLVCVFGLAEFEDAPGVPIHLWIDHVKIWEATRWQIAAAEALEVMETYRGPRWHLGDPAGAQAESDQESWESNLRGAGINLHCLPAGFNDFENQEWQIRNVQQLMDLGRIHFHRHRARGLIQSMQRWRRKVREGQRLVDVNGRSAPLKDEPSHACQALLYLMGGLVQEQRRLASERLRSSLPTPALSGPGSIANIGQVLEAFHGGGLGGD